jgi:hypothetical protein
LPLQNRVDPFGVIMSVPQRGLMMGNRGGRIHDPVNQVLLKRRYASRRWIICTCVYKDWHRKVMGDGYTELFFLDEVTALSAGHRPCAFCRREAFRSYRACIAENKPEARSVDEMDMQLHQERMAVRRTTASPFSLPNGAMVAFNKVAYAVRNGALMPWSFDGYGAPMNAFSFGVQFQILTPTLTIAALKNGYDAMWHPTAELPVT